MKHRHHIKPKHAGGTDAAENLVELSIDEHAQAHKLLWEEHGDKLDYVAWLALSGQIGREEARLAAMREVCSREEHRMKLRGPKTPEHVEKMLGNANGFKPGSKPFNKGKPITEWVTEESRIEWSNKMKGNKNAIGARTEEQRQKMRGPRSPLSEERKKEISQQMKEVWKRRKL
jgi:hypothetical protein